MSHDWDLIVTRFYITAWVLFSGVDTTVRMICLYALHNRPPCEVPVEWVVLDWWCWFAKTCYIDRVVPSATTFHNKTSLRRRVFVWILQCYSATISWLPCYRRASFVAVGHFMRLWYVSISFEMSRFRTSMTEQHFVVKTSFSNLISHV
jgi:hypothetical protein